MYDSYDYDFEGDGRQTSYILPLIALNVIVFLFSMGGNRLTELFKFHPYLISRLQLWRLVTYMFMHAGFSHLFFNMWGLYIFGRLLERALGSRRFLTLYLVSGIIGALTWWLFNYESTYTVAFSVEGHPVLTSSLSQLRELKSLYPDAKFLAAPGGLVGASGALFGVMVATAMAFPNMRVMVMFLPIAMKLKHFTMIYIAIEVFESISANSNIAHLAHLGGALGGFLYINYLRNRYR